MTLSNGTKLVKVRNPHGEETYTGPYSDSSTLWTTATRKEANTKLGESDALAVSDDGAFWMPFDDVVEGG